MRDPEVRGPAALQKTRGASHHAGVRLNRRLLRSATLGLAAGGAGLFLATTVALHRDLGEARQTIEVLRADGERQRDQVERLAARLDHLDRDVVDSRTLEAQARQRLLEELQLRAKGDADKVQAELGTLEERVVALRTAAEEHERLLADSQRSRDAARRVRGLMAPTVRVNALQEVGSGTALWSRAAGGGRARTYVLTAWHVVQEDAPTASIEVDFFAPDRTHRTERGKIVAKDGALDLALVEVDSAAPQAWLAHLPALSELERIDLFTPVHAIGCPLGYAPVPTSGELTSRDKLLDGIHYWMINAPTIFGNSGGGIYEADTHALIGVLSRISAYKNMIDVAVPHMGLVTPISDVYAWLDRAGYGFVWRDRVVDPKVADAQGSPTREGAGSVPASTPAPGR
jgi:S1-C subfamily serine protease